MSWSVKDVKAAAVADAADVKSAPGRFIFLENKQKKMETDLPKIEDSSYNSPIKTGNLDADLVMKWIRN